MYKCCWDGGSSSVPKKGEGKREAVLCSSSVIITVVSWPQSNSLDEIDKNGMIDEERRLGDVDGLIPPYLWKCKCAKAFIHC
jgi:hypothetical protein